MQTKDRRSGDERRASTRYQVEVEVEWQGAGERQPGILSDLSFDGCFILSNGDVQDGEPVRIFVPLADGMKVQFDGRVANHVFEIGFGVRLSTLSSPLRDVLTKIARSAEKGPPR
jgi:hypothetical protein